MFALAEMQAAAYDLERFAVRKQEVISARPELEVIRNDDPHERYGVLKTACVVLLVVAVVATLIYNKVVLTELSAQVGAARSELALLQNEYNMMLMEVEGQTSERLLEEEAMRLHGLSRVQSYQVEYVNLTEGDRIEATEVQPDLFRLLHGKVSTLLEYISER